MNVKIGAGDPGVGVRILDCDHREMSEMMIEIRADLMTGKERMRTGLLLRKLAKFSATHFALEEGMMAAVGYPGTALHSLRHQRLAEQMEAHRALYNRANSILNDNAIWSLTQAHIGHMEAEDLGFGLWLNGMARPNSSTND
jgi:hemerythrin